VEGSDLRQLTRKTCLAPRSDEFEGGQGQRSGSSSTKNDIFGPSGGLRVVYVWYNIFSL